MKDIAASSQMTTLCSSITQYRNTWNEGNIKHINKKQQSTVNECSPRCVVALESCSDIFKYLSYMINKKIGSEVITLRLVWERKLHCVQVVSILSTGGSSLVSLLAAVGSNTLKHIVVICESVHELPRMAGAQSLVCETTKCYER